ncbi:hypothetical protein [Rhodopirellula baltica]
MNCEHLENARLEAFAPAIERWPRQSTENQSMEEMVKCRDCGFFGVRNRSTRKIEEAEASIRTEGRIPTDTRTGTKLLYESTPVCVAGAADFRSEFENLTGSQNSSPGARLTKCCGKKRDCRKFVRWVIGMSPKDHIDMAFLAEEKRANREWLERGDREGREFHSRLEQERRDFDSKLASKSRLNSLFVAGIGIGGAIVGATFGALIK